MIIERKRPFLSSARIILDDELLGRAMREKDYAYITAISHNRFDLGADVSVKPKKTIGIRLQGKTIDELLQSFNDTSRNEVRRTFGMSEIEVRVDTDPDAAYDLYMRFERAQGRTSQRKESFLQSKIWNAYLEGHLVSSIACYDAKPILRIRAIYSERMWKENKEKYQKIGFATKRLVYEICKYGVENGYALVDMGAANFTDPAKKGVTQFKSSFGGGVMDEYTYTYKSSLFRFISKFIRL